MLKKMCRCGKVISYNTKLCDKCKEKHKENNTIKNRYYDNNYRDKKASSFYKSKEWLKTRELILFKYKGLDLYSLFIDNEVVYADMVHHIEELKENWDKRIEITNLIPLSNSNHNKIHNLYEKDKENIKKVLISLIIRWNNEYGRGGGM